jgi:hypothetical protein
MSGRFVCIVIATNDSGVRQKINARVKFGAGHGTEMGEKIISGVKTGFHAVFFPIVCVQICVVAGTTFAAERKIEGSVGRKGGIPATVGSAVYFGIRMA